jgi:hypothetical protein
VGECRLLDINEVVRIGIQAGQHGRLPAVNSFVWTTRFDEFGDVGLAAPRPELSARPNDCVHLPGRLRGA